MAFKKGTTVHESERQFIDCAHAPQCGFSAVIREKLRTGWANLCLTHYMEHLERERQARWTEAGRPEKEQSLAKMKGFGIKRIERIPGEDDDRIAA